MNYRFPKKTSIFANVYLKKPFLFFYGWLFINISVWGIRVYSETSQTNTVLILELFLKSSSWSFCQFYKEKTHIVEQTKNCHNFDCNCLQFKVVWTSQWIVDLWNGCIVLFRNRKWDLSPEKVRLSDRTKCLTAPVEAVCRTALLLCWPTWNSLEVIHYHRLVYRLVCFDIIMSVFSCQCIGVNSFLCRVSLWWTWTWWGEHQSLVIHSELAPES